MITRIRLLALAAMLGISVGAVACCAPTETLAPAAAEAGIEQDALAACGFYRRRLTSPQDRGSDVVSYLANGCSAVLTDLSTSKDLDEASVLHGGLYLDRLVELHAATEALSQRYRDAGAYDPRPSQTGEFLMARHLGVTHHFAGWRAAWIARQDS